MVRVIHSPGCDPPVSQEINTVRDITKVLKQYQIALRKRKCYFIGIWSRS